MRRLMELYRFGPSRSHPRQADLSLGLIEAQRSTLCLVVAHMLLGATACRRCRSRRRPSSTRKAWPAREGNEPARAGQGRRREEEGRGEAAAPPKAEEEDLDAVEAGTDGHIVTPVDDGGPGDGWAQAEAAEPVEKPLTKDADELAEFEKWAAGDEGAFDPNQFKDAPPTNDEDYSDDDEFYEEEDARRRRRPRAQGRRPDRAGCDAAP